MTFKRNIDRLPIIPADAKEHNVTCQFCIVGCGYKAYSWGMNDQGGVQLQATTSSASTWRSSKTPMTPNWYSPVDVQHRQTGRAKTSISSSSPIRTAS